MTQNNFDPAAGETVTAAPFDPVRDSRRLLRSIRAGALATTDPQGRPFASLVNVATAPDGSPILLLSRLAAHTRHLESNGHCALLLAETGKGDPLAHPRLTVTGTALRDPDPGLRARFLRRHPKAALYADFGDFGFWRMEVAQAHINGGFAKAGSVGGAALLLKLDTADELIAAEDGAVAHMNADHREAVSLYARHFAGETDGPWRMTGFDPEGMDLLAADRTARVLFPHPVNDPGSLRRSLVEMAQQARGAPGEIDPGSGPHPGGASEALAMHGPPQDKDSERSAG